MNDIIKEFVHELSQMSIDNLKALREEFLEELHKAGIQKNVIDFCGCAVDLVVAKKIEKIGTTVLYHTRMEDMNTQRQNAAEFWTKREREVHIHG